MMTLNQAFLFHYRGGEPSKQGYLKLIIKNGFVYDHLGTYCGYEFEHSTNPESEILTFNPQCGTAILITKWIWKFDKNLILYILHFEPADPFTVGKPECLQVAFAFEIKKLQIRQIAKKHYMTPQIQLTNFLPQTVVFKIDRSEDKESFSTAFLKDTINQYDECALEYDIAILKTLRPNPIVRDMIRKNQQRIHNKKTNTQSHSEEYISRSRSRNTSKSISKDLSKQPKKIRLQLQN